MSGVKLSLLRDWEKQFAFPVAHRTADGARRYRAEQVDDVRRVLDLREDGVPLAQAIDAARATAAATLPSAFEAVLAACPDLGTVRLPKRVLVGCSRALEDECTEVSELPLFFGMFQSDSQYRPAQLRWSGIAQASRATLVFGDFARLVEDPATSAPVLVPLVEGSPLRREWVVVCEAVEFRGALVAREIPGQGAIEDADRLFDVTWTVDPEAVRSAARACAQVAAAAGSVIGEELVEELSYPVGPGPDSALAADALNDRMLKYTGGETGFGPPHR